MEGTIAFLFIAGGIALTIYLVRHHRDLTNKAWGAAAATLDMQFIAATFFSAPKIIGELLENQVAVDTVKRGGGKSSKTYTRFRVTYPAPLNLGLKISRQGMFHGVARFFGAQDIEVGDPGFDDQVVIKGDSPKVVAAFLTETRRVRIQRAMSAFGGMEITDDGVCYERLGTLRNDTQIVETARRLAQLAWFLTGDRQEEAPLARAIEAKREGRLDEALAAVRQVPEVHQVAPVEAYVMESEILHLGGEPQQAFAAAEKARAQSPDDPEISEWSAHLGRSARAAAPGSDDPGAAVSSPSAPIPEMTGGIGADAFIDELFTGSRLSSETNQKFEAGYREKQIRWRGVLKQVSRYTFDFVFKGDKGAKAQVVLKEIEGTWGDTQSVYAIVQLPEGAHDQLVDRVGQEIAFEGRLLKIDALMNNVYVVDGHVTG